ncbi:hypothetical protein HNR46_004217 [Haloferula luteola]|uniref:Uncharacterized protein n=1 Tax=Haloferula luteola TaxID=595692 RepID=A0A840V6R1_9BACT|nr:hypothetical protein [Haloferula luteola]
MKATQDSLVRCDRRASRCSLPILIRPRMWVFNIVVVSVIARQDTTLTLERTGGGLRSAYEENGCNRRQYRSFVV